jgi:hypothetical protein
VDYEQNDFMARQQEGTGEWVLKSNEFQQWLEPSNQTLFFEIRASDTDMQKYLDRKLQNFQWFVSKELALQGEIKSRIAKAADGMYVLFYNNGILANVSQVLPSAPVYRFSSL